MLSHNIASKQANKDEGQSMGANGSGDGNDGGQNTSSLRPPEQTLNCPRCNSSNTKFCYYNNYSLAQPRHFCKTCRRYWTKGGVLRDVPIGGSCSRKNKRTKFCFSKSSSSDNGGMKFLDLSILNFQLGGLSYSPRVASSVDTSSSNHYLIDHDPVGYNTPFSSSQQHNQKRSQLGSFHHNTDLASSMESLSSINQDLHWKLQQQRLSMLFGGGDDENDQRLQNKQVVLEPDHQKPQPVLLQNLETSKAAHSSMDGDSRKENVGGCDLASEWFFNNSYLYPATSTNISGAGNDRNGSMNNWNWI